MGQPTLGEDAKGEGRSKGSRGIDENGGLEEREGRIGKDG